MERRIRRWFHGRGFTSMLLLIAFLLMAVSGVVLYYAPKGRDANWTGWSSIGLQREQWVAVHITGSLLFVLAALVHLHFNRRAMLVYVKTKAGRGLQLWKELLAALAIGAFVLLGTLYNVHPFRQMMRWDRQIKDYWAEAGPRAPYAHAEETTLAQFAGRVGASPEALASALRQEGLAVASPEQSLLEIAHENGSTPNHVFELLCGGYPDLRDLRGRGGGGRGAGDGDGRGAGAGRGSGGGQGQGQGPGRGRNR